MLRTIECINNRPIIGILTQPAEDVFLQWGTSYIAASYVKFIESGGGRVVPVLYPKKKKNIFFFFLFPFFLTINSHNSTTEQLDEIFDSINGLFFPGGKKQKKY